MIKLVYYYDMLCSICHDDLTVARELAAKHNISMEEVDVTTELERAGQNLVFAVPTIVLEYNQTEIHRESRIIDFRKLEFQLERFKEYTMDKTIILTVDIGNSNIVTVAYENEERMVFKERKETLRESDEEWYYHFFSSLSNSINFHEVMAMTVSCVVPKIRQTVEKVLQNHFRELKVYFLDVSRVPELELRLRDPETMGSDLIATTFGALAKYKDPIIVADLGSATKLTIVEEGIYHAGALLPGMAFSAQSIHEMIPHLPKIPVEKPEKMIGHDTIECIQSGIIYGTLSAILKMADGFEKEIGRPCSRVMTGGLSKLFTPDDVEGFVLDEFLLTDGLYYLTKKWLEEEK